MNLIQHRNGQRAVSERSNEELLGRFGWNKDDCYIIHFEENKNGNSVINIPSGTEY